MNELLDYTLHLADNALILGHRNSEWCGHGPVLEQDIAITNISLDLIGQARNFYQYAAAIKADGSTEDSLAYLRDPKDFKNTIMTELPRGDWGFTIARQFLFSQYQFLLYEQLSKSANEQLAAIATKALKEVTYHVRWSSEWIIRLGDGTEESQRRINDAVKQLWPYTNELFAAADYERSNGVDSSILKEHWRQKVEIIFEEALLSIPSDTIARDNSGKLGSHTEALSVLLAEMQELQRAHPGAEW